jgi:tetratricopeptide (TPR) repeat protein
LEPDDNFLNLTDHHTGGIIDRLLSEADKLYQMGRVQEAVAVFLQTIEQFPGDRRAYHAYSRVLIDGRQFEDGLDLLQQIGDSGCDQRTLELTGCCLLGLDRLGEAKECIGKILSENPHSAAGLSLMGQLAYLQGDLEGAAGYFKQVIQAEPDYGPACVNLGIIQWERGQEKAALDLIEKGFLGDPTDYKATTTYHAAVTELGAFERAEGVFRTGVKNCPHNERVQYLLIDVLVNQQKYLQALDEIQGALAVFGVRDGLIAAAEKIKSLAGQGPVENKSKNGCSLSVCLIVKNEEAHLATCLLSIKPVADEIIVVDTGSTDHSKAIAGLFGANVFDFKWVNDFAKARNYAISKARGEWILSLDADEAISPLDYDLLRKLVGPASSKSVAYSIVTRNYMNRVNAVGWSSNDGKYMKEEAGYGWFPSEKVRLFPNHANIRFEYPVHEIVEPALKRLGIDILPCSIPVHHYGKLNERKSTAKGRRYYQIGMKKLDEMANSYGAIRELAIQAANLEEYEDAVSLWQKVIKRKPAMADAYVNMGTAYWNLAKYHEAIDSAQKAMALAPNMKEAHFNCCLSLLHIGKAETALPVLKSLVAEFPDYLSARFLVAAALCCAGQFQEGAGELAKLKQSQLGSGLPISCHTLAQGLRSAGQLDYARAILDAARKTDNANDDVLALLKICNDTP